MTVTREQIENVLTMYLDDYVTDDGDVRLDEMQNVKKNFSRMFDTLMEEATPEEEPDDD